MKETVQQQQQQNTIFSLHFTFFCAVLFLGNSDAVKAEDLISVRNVMSGAAPLGATDIERLHKK